MDHADATGRFPFAARSCAFLDILLCGRDRNATGLAHCASLSTRGKQVVAHPHGLEVRAVEFTLSQTGGRRDFRLAVFVVVVVLAVGFVQQRCELLSGFLAHLIYDQEGERERQRALFNRKLSAVVYTRTLWAQLYTDLASNSNDATLLWLVVATVVAIATCACNRGRVRDISGLTAAVTTDETPTTSVAFGASNPTPTASVCATEKSKTAAILRISVTAGDGGDDAASAVSGSRTLQVSKKGTI